MLVGRAYELHFAAVVHDREDMVLDRSQCQSLIEEVEFIACRVDDPALVSACEVLLDRAALVIREPQRRLVIGLP